MILHYRHCEIDWVDSWHCVRKDECPGCGEQIDPSQLEYSSKLEERNATKLAEAKAWMGNKWLFHPDNRVERKNALAS